MLLNRGELDCVRLLSPKTVTLMTANQLPGGKEIADLSPAADAFNESGYRGIGFGLGVAVTLHPVNVGLSGPGGEIHWRAMAPTPAFLQPLDGLADRFLNPALSVTGP